MRHRSWDTEQLKKAVADSTSKRQVLQKLGLAEAGGNYEQIKKYITEYKLDTKHFTGPAWSKGKTLPKRPVIALKKILIDDSTYQSYKLKQRLFDVRLKEQKCEECGWAKKSIDGRIPVELDHINGKHNDNRIENLRVLCPNCHSLKPTHRGRNIKK